MNMKPEEQAPTCDTPAPKHTDVRCDKRPRHRGPHRMIVESAGGKYKGRWSIEWWRI